MGFLVFILNKNFSCSVPIFKPEALEPSLKKLINCSLSTMREFVSICIFNYTVFFDC